MKLSQPQIGLEVWTNQTNSSFGDGKQCVICIYRSPSAHHTLFHCSTVFFFAWERPPALCMSAAEFASRITALSRRASGDFALFDVQFRTWSAAQFRRPEPRAEDDRCAASASPEEAKFKTCLSCSFRATHFPFLYGKAGRSPGCAAVSRNQTNHPGCAASVDGETMISVPLTTLAKESQRWLESDVDL